MGAAHLVQMLIWNLRGWIYGTRAHLFTSQREAVILYDITNLKDSFRNTF